MSCSTRWAPGPLGVRVESVNVCNYFSLSGLCPLHSPLRLPSHPAHSRTLPSWTDAAYTRGAPSTHRAASAGNTHTHELALAVGFRLPPDLFFRIMTPHVGLNKASLSPDFWSWLRVWCDVSGTSWWPHVLINVSVWFVLFRTSMVTMWSSTFWSTAELRIRAR